MSNFGDHPAGFFADPSFYNGVATQSLRFDYDSAPTLYKTPSASSLTTWTWSAWFKLAHTTNTQYNLFSADSSSTNYQILALNPNTHGALSWVNRPAGGQNQQLITTQLFRDLAAWYHLVVVWDTTNGTSGDRSRMYLNGSRITSFATNTQPNQNTESIVNTNIRHNVGSAYAVHGNNVNGFNGYLAEVNFVDGLALDSSYFGETKNGVWIAKTPVVSNYGQNGYRLQFKNTAVSSASSSTIGADTSGKGNHYTSGGITASDCAMPDSPENNFASMTPETFTLATKSLAEAGLKLGSTDHQVVTANRAFPASGKWYWEVNFVKGHGGSDHIVQYIGVMSSDIFHAEQDISSFGGGNFVGSYIRNLAGVSWIAGNDIYYKNFTATSTANGANESGGFSEANGTGILGLALDVDAGTIKYYWNNSLVRTDSTLTANIEYFAHTNLTNSGGNIWQLAYFNFGQDSSFAGTKTAAGNTDANGNGDFFYAVPSGHLALCTVNFSEPTIGPNSGTDEQSDDYFNSILYTGNGGTGHAISGVGFQPDWTWIKGRSDADSHYLVDSSRGYTERLFAPLTDAATVESNTVTQVDSDGFTLGSDTGVNRNSSTYVAWNWKANGGTKTTNDASATSVGSIDSDIQANTTAGFSIVQYETNSGTSGSAQTVAHGLSAAPTFMILKSRDQAGTGWMVYYGDNTDYVLLNSDGATVDGASTWNDTSPTSTVFSIGTNGGDTNNTNGGSMIAYIFHDVEGYSKFGSYVGNGNADGTFIHLGFRPAWIMVKLTSGSGENWHMFDNKRATFNVMKARLIADGSSAENSNDSILDFTSNGFKFRENNAGWNGSGNTYIYMAFAEAPFKYANAR